MCLSFRKYSTNRLADAFKSHEEAAKQTSCKPTTGCMTLDGRSPENMDFDTVALLDKPKPWSTNQQVLGITA